MPRPSRKQRALRDLVEQLVPGAHHERLRAVDEGRVRDAVVDEGADDRGQLLARHVGARSSRGHRVVELLEVADEGEREELLLAGEVPVDDRPVDPDGRGDLLDLHVADTLGVEDLPGCRDDLGLPGTPTRGRGLAAPVGRRCVRHGLSVRLVQLGVATSVTRSAGQPPARDRTVSIVSASSAPLSSR